MQTTNPGRVHTAKTSYFQRVADDAKRQLNDVEVRMIFLSKQIDGMPADKVPAEIRNTLAHLDRQRRELKGRMSRALFNAGRI